MAPGIVQAVLDGLGNDELTLPRLMEPLPMSWTGQCALFTLPRIGAPPEC